MLEDEKSELIEQLEIYEKALNTKDMQLAVERQTFKDQFE